MTPAARHRPIFVFAIGNELFCDTSLKAPHAKLLNLVSFGSHRDRRFAAGHGVVVQWRCLPYLSLTAAIGNLSKLSVGPLLIFHFGFSERRLGAGTPKDRLFRLINQTFLNEHSEGAQNFRFVFGIHR